MNHGSVEKCQTCNNASIYVYLFIPSYKIHSFRCEICKYNDDIKHSKIERFTINEYLALQIFDS